ncbi:hypothetical protein KIW84_013635 [Lathyrus oleraceus]|uniref:Uncharacterized protein n=1 Tax=Pisum sativum TaxID=3888 RepID=A0A9D5BKY6_PEA|nr:hypothetical protein KIW84_013635 [Pisum sativum]
MNRQEWMEKLLGFEFEVVYKVGAKNKVVVSMSRQHGESESATMGFLEDKVVPVVDDDKNGGGTINMEEDVLANKNDVLTKV